MKEAFDIYFKKLNDLWMKEEGCYPKCVYSKKYQPNISTKLFLMETHENGYIQWQSKTQENSIDFESWEKELGFTIHPQIKEYFSTYWFMRLEGKIGNDILSFHKVIPDVNVLVLINNGFRKGKYHYQQNEIYFVIGSACVDGDDSYGICVNNKNGEVTFVQAIEKKSIKIADSLEKIIKTMEGAL